MKTEAVINIGVLGVASIATRYVVPAIITIPDRFKLAGLASRDLSRSAAVSADYGCKAFGSYESLLAEKNIDAVYIPLPNSFHYPYVKMALEQGKHVLVEKSLGCTLAEVQEMTEIARENNLVLLENFQFRFHSQLAVIQQILNEGTIGELRSVRISFGFPPFPDADNIRYKADLGGGALLDAGAYALKIAPYFLGDELFVAQGSMYYDPMNKVDIWGQGVLQQNNGPLCCQFSYGFDHHYQCALELWGSKGKLTTNRIFTAPPGYQPKLFVETKNDNKELILPADNHFQNMLKYFYSLINASNPVENEYDQNIKQAQLIDDFKKRSGIKNQTGAY